MRTFTAEELAVIAAADEEIEASFVLMHEEIALSRALDVDARHAVMDSKQLRNAESQRAYRAASETKYEEESENENNHT